MPFADGILTLLLPLLILVVLIVPNDNTPKPFVCRYCPFEPPLILTLPTAPKLVTPDTVTVANVPTAVMFD